MKKQFPLFNQHDSMDCGPACLRMVAKFYGKNFSLSTLRERSFITRTGVSMLGISDAAESIGFHTLGASLTFEQLLDENPLPCIAHWKQKHFVVIYKISSNSKFLFWQKKSGPKWIHVADPSAGLVTYKADEFKKAWYSSKKDGESRGLCLLLEPTPEFYNSEDEKEEKGKISYLFSYLKPYKSLIFQLLLGFLITSIFSLITPFLTQAIIDKGINYKDMSFLTLILIAQLVMSFGSASVGFIRGWITLHLTTRVNVSLLANFLTDLMRLPIAFFDNKMTGDIKQRIEDNQRIQTFLTSTSVNIIFAGANFVIFSCIIAYYSLTIFAVFLIGSLIYILWIKMFLGYRRQLDNRRFAQQSLNQSNVIELITGMQEIKLNNCEKQKRWEWERVQAMAFKISIKGLLIGQYQSAGALLINSTKNFTITFLVAKSVINGDMTLGMMLSVQFIIGQLNSPIESLISFIQNWQDAKISLERLNEIQQMEFEDAKIDERVLLLPPDKDIKIKNLSFQYEGARSPFVLKDINLHIPANKLTAIVGTSGSGKTTLVKLLLGFYPLEIGDIYIGTTLLSSIHTKTWRQHTGTVMQDGFIFSDTIANNIAISDESIDKDKLANAVKVANLQDFIDSLPMGYNTKIGRSGSGISQGQKQRILIARTVYKNPDFLFFDEATNALDANNELYIMNNMDAFFKDKTVVVVAHRLSTVKNADNIIVLDNGKVVEQGNHLELTKAKGAYFNLVKNQLELSN